MNARQSEQYASQYVSVLAHNASTNTGSGAYSATSRTFADQQRLHFYTSSNSGLHCPFPGSSIDMAARSQPAGSHNVSIRVASVDRTIGVQEGVHIDFSCRSVQNQKGEGVCAQFVHGRSRMTIDPRIPTMPGRSTSGFHQPDRHCLHQARSAVKCSASRMRGKLHPSKNHL